MTKSPLILLLAPFILGLSGCGDAGNGSGAETSDGNEIADTGVYDNRATTGHVGTVDQVEAHQGTTNQAEAGANSI